VQAPRTARYSLQKTAKVKTLPVWRKEDRADHIYRVAADVMCHKGYEATSMNDIADAVGLTKAGVYHYIRGKEDLLFQIMTFGMDMVDQDVVGPAQQIADPEDRLRTLVRRHAARILGAGGAVTILIVEDMQCLAPAHMRVVRDRQRAYVRFIRQTLEQLAEQGRLRDIDPTVASSTLMGMICWLARWYRTEGRMSVDEVVQDFVKMAMYSVLRDPARGA
jgi:AcrR family transcriptional regulator